MTDPQLGGALRDAVLLAVRLGGPALGASLAVGLVVSLLQAVTQVNEASLTFLPKIAAVTAVLFLTGGFMTEALIGYAHTIFSAIATVGGT